MKNFNSPNHGSNIQHLKHQAKTNLIKSVVTGEPTKLLRRRSNCKLGNTKSNCSRHILTTCISVVLNNFMKKRLTTKSREAMFTCFCINKLERNISQETKKKTAEYESKLCTTMRKQQLEPILDSVANSVAVFVLNNQYNITILRYNALNLCPWQITSSQHNCERGRCTPCGLSVVVTDIWTHGRTDRQHNI